MTQTIDWYVVEGSNVKGRNIKVICEAENPHEAMKTARNYKMENHIRELY